MFICQVQALPCPPQYLHSLCMCPTDFLIENDFIILYAQSLGLLGESLDPGEVARFLRHCPGLSKQTIGDLLGENDQFFLDVLDDFTATFNFKGALSLSHAGHVARHPCS